MKDRSKAIDLRNQRPQLKPLLCMLWEPNNRLLTLVLICREWSVPDLLGSRDAGGANACCEFNLNHHNVRRTRKRSGTLCGFHTGGFYYHITILVILYGEAYIKDF